MNTPGNFGFPYKKMKSSINSWEHEQLQQVLGSQYIDGHYATFCLLSV